MSEPSVSSIMCGKAKVSVLLSNGVKFLITDDEIRNRDLRIEDVISYDSRNIAGTVRVDLTKRERNAPSYQRA